MPEDRDAQIEQLTDRIQSLRDQCLSRSASRVAKELKSLAKQEGQVVPYLIANFYLMNDAQSLFEPEFGAEVAIESIALLESEEKARQLQPDFPEDHYWHTVQWMSSCAYDNLAKHVAEREGYNSDGVHDCINDGMQVCRRTGKLECLTCFREYATDVYRASDDLEMALHHARFVAAHQEDSNNDRRWVGAKDVTGLLLMSGQVDAAWDAAQVASGLAETYHNPLSARREMARLFETIHCLRGHNGDLSAALEPFGLAEARTTRLPDGENPVDDFQLALNSALTASCGGDHESAIGILTNWDRQLRQRQCLDHWFEARLRLIAALLLRGDRAKAESLGKDLEQRARPARDYLSLRRLKNLLEGNARPCPTAAAGTLTSGPFSDATVHVSVPGSAEAANEDRGEVSEAEVDAPPPTPLGEFVAEIKTGIEQSEGRVEVFSELLDRIRAVDPARLTDGEDAAWLLYLGNMLAHLSDRVADCWEWGRGLIDRFPNHPGVVNLVADLGESARQLCESEDEADEVVPGSQIEAWFRKSLDLDPNRPNNYARAGAYFQSIGKTGDAERCFARGFRLARGDSRIALNLAEIYAESERPRDALSVLDMCIREGTEDPALFWQAAMTAFSCERWESAVTYFDRFEQIEPGQAWANYYRAFALLEIGRPEEALDALQAEEQRNPECPLPIAALRAWAWSLKEQSEPFKHELRKVLATPLVEVDYMTLSGLARLFAKLDAASQFLPPSDSDRQELETRLLQTSFAPDEVFERVRSGSVEEVNFYVVRLIQELDSSWPRFPGCLHGQDDWTEYEARWGVLAASEDAAVEEALRWQKRCHPRPARLDEVIDQGGPYEDCPGVVWQAAHQPSEADAEPDDGDSE